MIVLRSEGLLARVDPGHGGELVDLVDLESGRQLLGRPPFGSTRPVAGDLDEETWTAAYRGGWQALLPNAGNSCVVAGVQHGFHGRASNDPWSVAYVAHEAATLRWEGHGLRVERRYVLEERTLVVSVAARAGERSAPLVAVEHIALGMELFEPEVEIGLPGGRAYELSETEGPARPPENAPTWPDALLLDGSVERCDRWRLVHERSRLLAVADLPEGRARIVNPARKIGLELSWDTDWLRHLWLWHEVRTYGGPWRKQAEMLVIEPASVPHPLGLAEALENGQAGVLEPGGRLEWQIRASVVEST